MFVDVNQNECLNFNELKKHEGQPVNVITKSKINEGFQNLICTFENKNKKEETKIAEYKHLICVYRETIEFYEEQLDIIKSFTC